MIFFQRAALQSSALPSVFRRGVVCLMFLLFAGGSWLFSGQAQAQSIVDLFLGKSNNTFRFQTPEQRLQKRIRDQWKQARTRYKSMLQQDQLLQTRVEKKIREYREIANRTRNRRAFMPKGVLPLELKQREKIVRQAERNRTLLVMLQFALSSRRQNSRELQESLQKLLNTRQTLSLRLKKRFTHQRQLPRLEKRELKAKLLQQSLRHKRKKTRRQLRKLKQYLEVNVEKLRNLRERLSQEMTLELQQQATSTSTKASRQQKGKPARFLFQLLLRMQFEFSRWRNEWLLVQRESLQLELQNSKQRIQHASFVQELVESRRRSISSRTRLGLWYQVTPPIQSPGVLFSSWWGAIRDGWEQQRLSAVKWKKAQQQRWARATSSKVFLTLSGLLLLFLFTVATSWNLSRWSEGWKVFSEQRMESHPRTRPLWQLLWLLLHLLGHLRWVLLFWFWTFLLVRVVQFPWTWQKLFPSLWLGLGVSMAFWLAGNILFAREQEERFFQVLDDDYAQNFRRLCKTFGVFLGLFLLKLPLVRWWFFPDNLIYAIHVLYYASLILCVLWLLLSRDALLTIIPKDTAVGRFVILFIYRFNWLLIAFVLGLFGVYVAGYINFSAFLGRALFLTTVVGMGMYAFHRVVSMAAFSLLGLTDAAALEKKERRWARHLHRLVRWVTNVVSLFLGISLLFSVWDVANGFTTTVSLFQHPLLQVQNTQISLLSLLQLVLVLGVSLWLSSFLRQQLNESVYPALRMKPDNRYAIDTIVHYLLVIVGLLTGLQWVGIGFGALAVVIGILGIGIGFGLQNIANNFISSLIIIFGKSIKVGDVIEAEGMLGEVKVISARSTTIECLDNKIVLIPNSELLTKRVINWSQGSPYIMADLRVGIAYGTDTHKVRDALLDEAGNHPEVLNDPTPVVRFADFGSHSLDFILWVGLSNPLRRFAIISELRYNINARFEAMNIVIAFPQQDIHFSPVLEESLLGKLSQHSVTVFEDRD